MLSSKSLAIYAKAFQHLIGMNLELAEERGSKTGAQRAIHGIASARHDDTPDTRVIMARVKCIPA